MNDEACQIVTREFVEPDDDLSALSRSATISLYFGWRHVQARIKCVTWPDLFCIMIISMLHRPYRILTGQQ